MYSFANSKQFAVMKIKL